MSARRGRNAVVAWVRRHWKVLQYVVPVALLALVGALLAKRFQSMDWDQVLESVKGYDSTTLSLAAGLTALSYLLYSCFDLIGRSYTQHRLPAWRVLTITGVCYALTLNLGTWIGGIALRYRLYSRAGLRHGVTSRILGAALATNWLGCMFVAGLILVAGAVPVAETWAIGRIGMRGVGLLFLTVVAAYFGAALFAKRRSFTIRKHKVALPSARMAFSQLALSSANWMTMGAIITVLMPEGVSYTAVTGVLLISAFAGLVVRVPAGLGVMEAVFFAFLGDTVQDYRLLAALLTYRAIYYLVPLVFGLAVYVSLETTASRRRAVAHA